MKRTICFFLVATLMLGSTGWWSQASAQSKILRMDTSNLSDAELKSLIAQTEDQLWERSKGVAAILGQAMEVTITRDAAGHLLLLSLYPNLMKAMTEYYSNMVAIHHTSKRGGVGVGVEADPGDPKFPENLLTIFLMGDRVAESSIRLDMSSAAPWLSEDQLEFVVNQISDQLRGEEIYQAFKDENELKFIFKLWLMLYELHMESVERARQRSAAYDLTRRIFHRSPNPGRPGSGFSGRLQLGNGSGTTVTTNGRCQLPVYDPTNTYIVGYVWVSC